jgi:heme-degrading monooxygenase HmoA
MIVRIASVQVEPERIDEMISHYRETLRPVHEQCQGLRQHYWLVDRYNGHVKIVGFWDSQEALDKAKPALEPARERYWEAYQETPTLEAYEVADEI